MVIKATKLTPEVLLSAPRRSPAVPNHDGTLALYSISAYSFEDKKTKKEIYILDINTSSSTLFTDDSTAHDATWIGDGTNSILWLRPGAKGITSLMIGDGSEPTNESYTADVIPAPISSVKLKALSDGTIACAMTGLATPEGLLYNQEAAGKPASSARIYDKLHVRFWDKYRTPQRSVIWYSKLKQSDGKYSLAALLRNALEGTDLECPFYSLTDDGSSGYDISSSGILFSALNPNGRVNADAHSSVYFIPLSTFTEERVPKPQLIDAGDHKGSTSNPRFSPSATIAAFLVAPTVGSTDQRIMLVPDLQDSTAIDCGEGACDLSPSSFEWSRDGNSLLLTAENYGRLSLYKVSLFTSVWLSPIKLSWDGAISGFFALGNSDDKLLVSSTSFVDSSTYSIIDCSEPENSTIVSSILKNGEKLGLSRSQVSEIWFEGAGDYCVHAWVMKPRDFDEDKKYPLAILIHGGPKDSWLDSWSTRWNPAVWAEQGYVCVMPNITGSTGYGLDFVEGINGEWGGRAYEDLVNCFEHVEKAMPFVDTDNAIAAGGSYGGYMAFWIQGMPLGRKFKAIVAHDGLFNTETMMSGDEFGGESNFQGPALPWINYRNLKKYNPARHDLLKNWKTPMLIIHSDLDYRCVVTDGIAAFGVLQMLQTPSKFLNFPDENHWVLKPENSLVWHKTVFDWINKYTRNPQSI